MEVGLIGVAWLPGWDCTAVVTNLPQSPPGVFRGPMELAIFSHNTTYLK